jgi:glycosidase
MRLSLLLVAFVLAGAPPEVLKVEPPTWWAGHSLNPVRLLIRGTNLHGIRAEGALPIGRIAHNAAGTYAFVDVFVPPNTSPGKYPLKLWTSEGTAAAPFEVIPKLEPNGRFQGFSPDDVIYLLMPDRFANGDSSNDTQADRTNLRRYHGGDLQGIINRLPYLRDLGITAVWVNPIYDNTGDDYHGYGAVDFYAVDEHLGDAAKFREFVDAAHRHGLRVIQDQVANHTGPRHPWTRDPPTPAWFNGTADKHLRNNFQIWTLVDPHASAALRRPTLEGWFLNILPDLNQDDEEVRRYLIQNSLWWVGISGIDGIRQDTLPYVPRRFWSDWMAAIRREYPSLRVVGEVLNGDPALVSTFQRDTDTVFDFPLYFAIRNVFAEGKSVRELPSVLAHDHLYPDSSVLVTLLGLHDVLRFMGAKGATIEGLKLAFTFLLTTRGTPLIYYGDEIAMRGGDDPDNRRDFPGGWPGDPLNAFEARGRTSEQNSVFTHVQKLLRLRAATADLRRGKLTNLLADEQQYLYRRGDTLIAINNDVKASAVQFELGETIAADDFLGSGIVLRSADGVAAIQLPARSAAIFSLKRPR